MPTTQNDVAVHSSAMTELQVSGMTCNNCVRHVTEALREIPGVDHVETSLQTGNALITWLNPAPETANAAIQALQEAGYDATVVEAQSERPASKLSRWERNALVGTICTALLMVGEWSSLHTASWFPIVAFILASIVQVVCGSGFYRGAWSQLKVGRSNMDTLVSLGSTTAYAFSVWALVFRPGTHLYFMEAAGIITFVSIGHWIEGRASNRASAALHNLLTLAPQKAVRRNRDGTEQTIAVNQLNKNDEVVLRPGNNVPTDGTVLSGDTSVNESMLTGEALPVTKKTGDQIFAGTTILDGQVIMQVTATGNTTALAQIIAAVRRAQDSRADIQRLADSVSNIFVPIVIFCAILTGLWWGLFFESAQTLNHTLFGSLHLHGLPTTPASAAFIYAAAVLIVACPCAMGLATPIAIMAGTNAAAAEGILIRDGVALEKAGKISAVLFDKTGTLTFGAPHITAQHVFRETVDNQPTIATAASLAHRSNHPLSKAVAALQRPSVASTEWQEIRGSGVQAKLQGTDKIVRLGSVQWIASVTGAAASPIADSWMDGGATVLALSIDNDIAALFALKDKIKEGAAEVIEQLSEHFAVYLVTGDNSRTAQLLGKELGIPTKNIAAEIRPENKAAFVKELQQRGERVAFVGDGINDAPALEQADLGVAVAKASDIATEAADIILLRSDIHAITGTLQLAAATLRTIRQNLFWAFFYNAASIPLAALGFLSPMLCAAAMGLSDLVVVGNALRLRRWRINKR